MKHNTDCSGLSAISVRAILPVILALAAGGLAQAEEGQWILQLAPMYMKVEGHEQHVLTIHETDNGPPSLDNKKAVSLETGRGVSAIRLGLQHPGEPWGWGLDFFIFGETIESINLSAAAGGAIDQVVFEFADGQYASNNSGEVLFYRLLEDNRLEIWTLDLYGIKTLSKTADSSFQAQLGIRFGDFDNDYRAAVGIENVEWTRLDTESNYPRMMGPLVGLAVDTQLFKGRLQGYLGQSVLIGSAALGSRARHFNGAFNPDENVQGWDAEETFNTRKDAAIPVTEFRLKWTYALTQSLYLAVSANTSSWWDVPVPPGVNPGPGDDEVIHENTVVLFGALAGIEWTF